MRKKNVLLLLCLLAINTLYVQAQNGLKTREYWVAMLDKISYPVISSLANDELKEKMPIETQIDRAYHVAYLVPMVCFLFCAYYGWKGYKVLD